MPVLEPRQTWQIIPARQLSGLLEQRVLIVGQMLASGTATAGDLVRDIGNSREEDTLFGRRSHIAGMVREFKDLNPLTALDCIPLADNGAAVKGEASIAFSGTATADADIVVTVGSDKRHRKTINVLSGDAAADVAAAVEAAFDADLDAPYIASSATGTATFTAENGGTLSNDWCIKIEGSVPGITYVLTGWASGATDPVLTGVLDVIGDIRYKTVIWPSAYALTEVQDLLDSRFNSQYLIMDGVAIQTIQGTLATVKAYTVQNSQNVVVLANKAVSESDRIGAAIMEMPDIMSSEFGALRALRYQDDAPIARFLSTVSPLDQFGGRAIASLPYFNSLMPNLPVPDPRDEFSLVDQAEFTSNGVSVIGANRAFNGTILGQIVTTYLNTPAGNPDDSYKFLETVDTASVIREFIYENCRTRYAQTRLTEGDLIQGRDMANAASIRAFLNTLYDVLAEDALVQSGTAAKKDFNLNLVIAVNVRTGTVTINMKPLLVTQLRAILGTIQINFGA